MSGADGWQRTAWEIGLQLASFHCGFQLHCFWGVQEEFERNHRSNGIWSFQVEAKFIVVQASRILSNAPQAPIKEVSTEITSHSLGGQPSAEPPR